MSDEFGTGGAPSPEDIDPGEPVAELAELAEEPPNTLIERVRQSIQRRVLFSQFVDLSLPLMLQIFVEYLSIFFSPFADRPSRRGESETWKTDSE